MEQISRCLWTQLKSLMAVTLEQDLTKPSRGERSRWTPNQSRFCNTPTYLCVRLIRHAHSKLLMRCCTCVYAKIKCWNEHFSMQHWNLVLRLQHWRVGNGSAWNWDSALTHRRAASLFFSAHTINSSNCKLMLLSEVLIVDATCRFMERTVSSSLCLLQRRLPESTRNRRPLVNKLPPQKQWGNSNDDRFTHTHTHDCTRCAKSSIVLA